MWGNTIWGGGSFKNPIRLLVWWSSGNCWIHVNKYFVHARLDYYILSQSCRNALLWHAVAQLVSAENETLLWLMGMNYVKIRNYCNGTTFRGLTFNWESRISALQAELKTDASETVKEWKYCVLTWLHAS